MKSAAGRIVLQQAQNLGLVLLENRHNDCEQNAYDDDHENDFHGRAAFADCLLHRLLVDPVAPVARLLNDALVQEELQLPFMEVARRIVRGSARRIECTLVFKLLQDFPSCSTCCCGDCCRS